MIFTTLHTADTVSSIIRLLNLGMKITLYLRSRCNFLAAKIGKESYVRIVKQRKLTDFEKVFLKKYSLDVPDFIYSSTGCDKCNGGYLGRTLILEHLIFDDELKEIINGDCNSKNFMTIFQKTV